MRSKVPSFCRLAGLFRMPVVVLCLVLGPIVTAGPALAQDPLVVREPVFIPLENGSVSATQFYDAISQDLHWVAGSITAFTRGMGVADSGFHRLSKTQVDQFAEQFPDVFSYTDVGGQPHLRVDVEELSKTLADRKSRLRRYLAQAQNAELASLDKIESTWNLGLGERPRRILVLLSGFHGTESSAEAVGKAVHEQTQLPTCVFRYPNDGPVAESAGMLVLRLQDLHMEYPTTPITLIAHSMGGLVSRAAIEMQSVAGRGTARNSVVERTGVEQLIMVCPPNHGSILAEYGALLEGAEQLYRIVQRRADRKNRVLFRAIVDGFNEASVDLQPDSQFLQRLNQHARNPQVRYSILAGTGGPVRGLLTGLLSSVWDQIAVSVDEPQELDRRIRDVLTCDELHAGRGDGVVSVKSAQLPGVADIEFFPMHHLVWDQLDSNEGKVLLQEITNRLGIAL